MARMALGLTISLGGAAAWLALDEFGYLAVYRDELLRRYGLPICLYSLALGLDMFAILYWTCRRLGLGDAGRKLRRLDSEVRRGETFDGELARRLRAQQEGKA